LTVFRFLAAELAQIRHKTEAAILDSGRPLHTFGVDHQTDINDRRFVITGAIGITYRSVGAAVLVSIADSVA
jgi:hypothetical protein